MKRRWPSAKMMSNASDDLPDPDTPVSTVSWRRGISSEMFLRLCSRAPRREMTPGPEVLLVIFVAFVPWDLGDGWDAWDFPVNASARYGAVTVLPEATFSGVPEATM